MSQQPPDQRLNIDDASIEGSQIGQAGRDLIQGQVINLTVYDSVDMDGLLGRQISSLTKPLTQQEYRKRNVLLNRVKKFWIEDVLEKSLHVRALIELGLEERLDAVDRPFSGVQELPDETRKTLPAGTGMTQVFNQMGEGRTLLILGEPGAGKTTMLLKLLQNLIARIEEEKDLSQLIPVVFHLSSWARERQSIADWLIEELSSKYEFFEADGKTWIREQQLLLLLDGLDEVKAERRDSCAQALNEFRQTHGQTEIVVCSRIRDYEALATPLRLQGAICIQSLTLEQINQYLEQAGDQLEAVKTLLQEDTTLQELAKSPLTLSVMSLAYQGSSVEDLPQTGSVEARRQHLFNTYIERMFRRRRADQRYSKVKAVRWLNWLAQQLQRKSQTEFRIEEIQPSWLKTTDQKWRYRIGVGVITALTSGLISSLVGWPIHGLIFGLVFGLVFGLINMFREEIRPVEILEWSWTDARNWLGFIMAGALIGGLLHRPMSEIAYGLILGLVLLASTSLTGRPTENIQVKKASNQGIRQSIVMAVIFGPLFGLVTGWIIWLNDGPKGGLNGGLLLGLMIGLSFGGFAFIQHFTLRLVLYFGGFTP